METKETVIKYQNVKNEPERAEREITIEDVLKNIEYIKNLLLELVREVIAFYYVYDDSGDNVLEDQIIELEEHIKYFYKCYDLFMLKLDYHISFIDYNVARMKSTWNLIYDSEEHFFCEERNKPIEVQFSQCLDLLSIIGPIYEGLRKIETEIKKNKLP